MPKLNRLLRILHKAKTRVLLRRFFKFLTSLLIIYFIIFIFHFLFYIDKINVKVDGIESETSKEIEEELNFYINGNYFFLSKSAYYFFRKDELEEIIKQKYPWAYSLDFDYKLFFQWDINVINRTALGANCDEEEKICLLVDREGLPFLETEIERSVRINTFIEVEKGVYLYNKDIFDKIYLIKDFIENNGYQVHEINIDENGEDVLINTKEGIGFVFSTNNYIYETTRAIHITLNNVFFEKSKPIYVNVIDPLRIKYKYSDE